MDERYPIHPRRESFSSRCGRWPDDRPFAILRLVKTIPILAGIGPVSSSRRGMRAARTAFFLCALCASVRAAPMRIVFVGDSITGQSRNHPDGFARQMDAALAATQPADSPVEVVALGGSGQTVGSWRHVEKTSRENPATLDIRGVDVRDELAKPADALLVMLGMNDVLSPSMGDAAEDVDRWRAQLVELVDALVARTSPRALFLASSPPCTEDPASPKNRLLGAMAKRAESVAEEKGGRFVPVHANLLHRLSVLRKRVPDAHVTQDFVHPNTYGHLLLAEQFLRALDFPEAADWLAQERIAPYERALAEPWTDEAIAAFHARPAAAPWLVCAPIRMPHWGPGNRAFEPDKVEGPVEAAVEAGKSLAEIRAMEGLPAWTKAVASLDYTGGDNPDSLDFAQVLHARVHDGAYAARVFACDRDLDALLRIDRKTFAGEQHLTVWLNGERLFCEPFRKAEIPVSLRRGENLLFLRTAHLSWQWQLSAGLAPADGGTLEGVRIATEE
jgi:lysophospholipase L1-like esterase